MNKWIHPSGAQPSHTCDPLLADQPQYEQYELYEQYDQSQYELRLIQYKPQYELRHRLIQSTPIWETHLLTTKYKISWQKDGFDVLNGGHTF